MITETWGLDLYFEYCWKHKSFWLLGKRVPVVENMVQCSIISDSQNFESIFRTFDFAYKR